MAIFTPEPERDEDRYDELTRADEEWHAEIGCYCEPQHTDPRDAMERIYRDREAYRRDLEQRSEEFPQKTPFAGDLEAAGIEPASESPPNVVYSSDFSFKTELADYTVAITDGQLFIYTPGGEGSSEPISHDTVSKLAALAFYAARVPQEGDDGT